jgi:hypothetical protein
VLAANVSWDLAALNKLIVAQTESSEILQHDYGVMLG